MNVQISAHTNISKVKSYKNYNFGTSALYAWRLFLFQHFNYTSALQFKPNDKKCTKQKEKKKLFCLNTIIISTSRTIYHTDALFDIK